MEKKLVSIITPSYNSGEFIKATIDSVRKQTYVNWEMIIVDDCSTDNTQDIVAKYIAIDSRIHFFKLEINSGAAIARTEAIKLATGKYIAFLDSDDIWHPNKLERQINYMEKNKYNITCTSYEKYNEKNKTLKLIESLPKTDYKKMLSNNTVGNSTLIYNANKLGKFEVPTIRKRNDYALWLKLLKKEKYIYGMPEVLMKYRVRNDSISSNKMTLIKYHWILYRKIEHLSVGKSIFHIIYWIMIKMLKR